MPETKASSVPKALEIRPDDSQEAIEKKKRKLNMFKRQEKKEKEEQQSDSRCAESARFTTVLSFGPVSPKFGSVVLSTKFHIRGEEDP